MLKAPLGMTKHQRRMSMTSKMHRANPSVYNEDDSNPSFDMTNKTLDTSILRPKNTIKQKIDFLSAPKEYKKLPKRILAATITDSKVFDRKPDNFSSLLLNLNSVENLENVDSLHFLNRITKNGVEF